MFPAFSSPFRKIGSLLTDSVRVDEIGMGEGSLYYGNATLPEIVLKDLDRMVQLAVMQLQI